MSKKLVTLMSSDGIPFEVEEAAVVSQSQTIKHMIENGCSDNIPMPVTCSTLSRVIEYCNIHAKDDHYKIEHGTEIAEEALRSWDGDFILVDQLTLYNLATAASYLKTKSLLDLTCQKFAKAIKGKTPEEIRVVVGRKYAFTLPEEFRRTYQWAFES